MRTWKNEGWKKGKSMVKAYVQGSSKHGTASVPVATPAVLSAGGDAALLHAERYVGSVELHNTLLHGGELFFQLRVLVLSELTLAVESKHGALEHLILLADARELLLLVLAGALEVLVYKLGLLDVRDGFFANALELAGEASDVGDFQGCWRAGGSELGALPLASGEAGRGGSCALRAALAWLKVPCYGLQRGVPTEHSPPLERDFR
mmetsp:Transcript_24163/g.68439  ORF Transcript_24163/g.68439 Transcript_24163/m.68439 type:complete len:207 (+) Transcript_24163:32-652(+)